MASGEPLTPVTLMVGFIATLIGTDALVPARRVRAEVVFLKLGPGALNICISAARRVIRP